ncbi:MAG: 1-deoxy-D-xylulose-5-phosphate reductoisomerase [Actinomycetota bacterium]
MEEQPRRVVVLGSTGSIGRQALDVVSRHRTLQVVGLAAGSDAQTLAAQADAHAVARTALGERDAVELARFEEADVVLNAIVGAAGLPASIAALEAGKVLALANKESLVAGGDACAAAARRGGGRIVPVDSEHAALRQCLSGHARADVDRIVLTASGGPFRTRADLGSVTVQEALRHPSWDMGPKITVDSATLMNKGLEIIEAHHLFGFDYDHIDVLIHPQSAVHALVHLKDGSTLMHAAPADMRIPIQAALIERIAPTSLEPLDLAAMGSLDFEEVDGLRFPALGLAYEAGSRGRSFPAVLNAANEEGVRAFLDHRLSFTAIVEVTRAALEAHEPQEVDALESVLDVDAWARAHARAEIDRRAGAASVPASAGRVGVDR